MLFVVFGVERDGDGDAGVFCDFGFGACLSFLFVFVGAVVFVVVVVAAANVGVGTAVDDQAALTNGDELLEDFAKGDGDLSECAGDGFVFALI